MSNYLLSATFVKNRNKFDLKLDNGTEVSFLYHKIAALKGLDHSVVEGVSIQKKGTVLRWESIDLSVPVKELCATLLRGEIWSRYDHS